MADNFQVSVVERKRANERGGRANRARCMRIDGGIFTIDEVEARTGLTSSQISAKASRARARGDAVTWEALA